MKKFLTLVVAAILSLTATACDNNNKKMESETSLQSESETSLQSETMISTDAKGSEEIIISEVNTNNGKFQTFNVNENNTVYTLETDTQNETFVITLCEIDKGGESKEYNVSYDDIGATVITCMCAHDNKIYYAGGVSGTVNESYISMIDLSEENKKGVLLYTNDEYNEINKIDYLDDKLYIIGEKPALKNKEYSLCPPVDGLSVNFNYKGQAVGVYSLNDKTFKDVPVEFPIALSATLNNSVIYYAYDSIKGYHFVEYSDDKIFDKIYNNNFKIMDDFDIFSKDNNFVYSGGIDKITIANVSEKSATTELLDKTYTNPSDSIRCNDGYIYFVQLDDDFNKHIKYFDTEGHVKNKPPIKLISSQFFYNIPYGCGYPLDNQQLAEDGFALNIMSQSTDFDLCLVNSEQTFSDSMKTKGAFEPLNGIPAVVEYLDKCFPALKEAAMNEKDEIWMLPIKFDVPVILYNGQNCEKQGFKFTNTMSVTDFIDIVEKSHLNSDITNFYDANAYRYSESMISQYLAAETTFETPLFRTLLPILKDRVSGTTAKFTKNINIQNALNTKGEYSELSKKIYDNFLYTLLFQSDNQRNVGLEIESYNAIRLPKLVDEAKSSALCSYICVNPYSANKEVAMEYIEELAKYMMKQKDSLLLKDPEMYSKSNYATDLLSIYNDAKVNFALPGDIFAGNYSQYVYGLLDEDEFITEADRKWDAYRNE